MSQGKDFSVLKWLIFPPLIFALSFGIAYFNVDVFGWRGSVLYLIALGAVNVVGFVMTKFSGSTKRPVRIASFIFESLMIAALVVNIAYSLSAQRDLSLVKQDGAERKSEIAEIGKLRSRKAQATLAEKIGEKTDVRTAFGRYESVLFWIMVSELSLAFAGLMAVFGLAAIKPGLRRIPRGAFRGARGVSSLAPRREIGFGSPVEANGSIVEADGSTVSEWKIHGQDSGVRVRRGGRYAGHVTWPEYLASVSDPKNPTEAEIESLLNSRTN